MKTALRRPVWAEPAPRIRRRPNEGALLVTLECGHVVRRPKSMITKRVRCPVCTQAMRQSA